MLSKPTGVEKIAEGLQVFVSERLKHDLYNLVMRAFKESEMSQSDLASRLGKDKALLSRNLSTPSNWTIETVARLLYAINGSRILVSTVDPDTSPLSNYTQPEWASAWMPSMPSLRIPSTERAFVVATLAPQTDSSPGSTMVKHIHFSSRPDEAKQESKSFRVAAE